MTEMNHPFTPGAVSPERGGAVDAGTDAVGSGDGTVDDRPLRPAMITGWRRKCPSCHSGPMFKGYLKVNDTCPVCKEELRHHRADDGPAYLTILIVGHIMAPSLLFAFETLRPDPLVLFSFFAVGCVTLSLYLLPRLKGAIVAYQWARRMYGFASSATPGTVTEDT